MFIAVPEGGLGRGYHYLTEKKCQNQGLNKAYFVVFGPKMGVCSNLHVLYLTGCVLGIYVTTDLESCLVIRKISKN